MYNSELYHYGRKGMKWYQHIYGEADSRAKYNKNTEELYGRNYEWKNAEKKLGSFNKRPISQDQIKELKTKQPNLKHIKTGANTRGFIFTKNGEPQAVINTEKKQDGIWIQGLEVFGKAKGQGLSYELLDVATKELGASKLSVNKNNKLAKAIYDKYASRLFMRMIICII